MPFQPPPAQRLIERVRSRIYEGATLTTYDYRSVIVPVYTALSSSVSRGNAVFRIPFNQEFRVQQLTAHVVPSATLRSAANTFDFAELEDAAELFAMNCRLDVKIVSGRQMLFAQKGLVLADLQKEAIRFFDVPLNLPAGTSVEVLASLQDAAAMAPFNAIEYGINLVGAYVRNT